MYCWLSNKYEDIQHVSSKIVEYSHKMPMEYMDTGNKAREDSVSIFFYINNLIVHTHVHS